MGPVKQVIVVRKDLRMRKGKLASQVAHAAMKFILDNNEADHPNKLSVELSSVEALWLASSFTKIVVSCDSESELLDLITKAELNNIEVHPIVDNGTTEFNGTPTLTCAAFGPDSVDVLDEITGKLPLI